MYCFRSTLFSGKSCRLSGEELSHPLMVDRDGERSKSVLASLYGRKKPLREEGNEYPFTLAVLSDDWRLIECRDRIQWILQWRSGMDQGEPRWRGRHYCRTKAGLQRCIREAGIEVGPDAREIINSLPDRI